MIKLGRAGESAMARFSGQLRFPSTALVGRAAGEQLAEQLRATIQAAQLAVAYRGPTGLTAQARDRRDPCDPKLVLSWGRAAGAAGVMALLLELQSHEAMACGAPLNQHSFSALLETLLQALPGLEVLERSDQRRAPGLSRRRQSHQEQTNNGKRLRDSADVSQGGSMDIPMAAGGQELLVFRPRDLRDAKQLIGSVRENRAVVLHTGEACDGEAQRLIDDACGGMEAIGAQVHRVDAEMFLLAPPQVCVQLDDDLGRQVA
jgi:FtsZ-interacting cell division protein YlmF